MNRTFSRWLAGVLVSALGSVWAAEPPKFTPAIAPPVWSPPQQGARLSVTGPVWHTPEEAIAATAARLPAGTRFAAVNAMLVQVPHDFAENAGLAWDGKKDARQWSLSKREAKLFSALLAADKRCEVVSNPWMHLEDGKEGLCRVEQNYDVLGPLTVTEEKGERIAKAKVTQQTAGFSLGMTPTIATDGLSLTAKLLLRHEQVASQEVALPTTQADGSIKQTSHAVFNYAYLGDGSVATATNSEALQANLRLVPGETQVLGGVVQKGADGKQMELLVVLNATVGVGTKK